MDARLILIPGWASGPACWDSVLDALPGADARILPWETCLANDNAVHGAIASATAPVFVAGWSMGALVALDALTRGTANVAGLVLIAGTARMTADDGYPGADARALRAMRLKLPRAPEAVLKDFASLCVAPGSDDEFVARFAEEAARLPTDALASGLRYLAGTDVRSALTGLEVPALVVHGRDDQVIPAASGRYLAETLPNAAFEPLTGAPHAVLHTHPAEVAGLMKGFLDARLAG